MAAAGRHWEVLRVWLEDKLRLRRLQQDGTLSAAGWDQLRRCVAMSVIKEQVWDPVRGEARTAPNKHHGGD